jgi:hypothetical protein
MIDSRMKQWNIIRWIFLALLTLCMFGGIDLIALQGPNVRVFTLTPLDLFVLCFIGVIVALSGISIGLNKRMRAAVMADNDSASLPLSEPDPSLALPIGESLSLTHQRTRYGVRRMLFYALPLFYLPIYLPLAFSSFSKQADLAPFTFPILLPLFLVGYDIMVAVFIVQLVNMSRVTIALDDDGITILNRWTTRRMAWGEIRAITSAPYSGTMPQHGVNYSLMATNRQMQVSFAESKRSFALFRRQWERFEGGVEAYQLGMQRVLATLVARTGLTIRRYPLPRSMAASEPFDSTTVQMWPSAPADMQPQPFAPGADFASTGTLRLQARVPWGNIIVISLLIPGMFAGCIASLTLTIAIQAITQVLIVFLAIWLPVMFLSAACMVSVYSSSRQPVIATDQGIQRFNLAIPWDLVSGWAVKLPPDPSRRIYTIYSDFGNITWIEDAAFRLAGSNTPGDRKAAFRHGAEELHALIASRTGLPLRRQPM